MCGVEAQISLWLLPCLSGSPQLQGVWSEVSPGHPVTPPAHDAQCGCHPGHVTLEFCPQEGGPASYLFRDKNPSGPHGHHPDIWGDCWEQAVWLRAVLARGDSGQAAVGL